MILIICEKMNSQKRLLLTLKYLWNKTDEEHPTTLKDIGEYGDCVFLPEIKPGMQAMADELGVSFTAMLIQLRKYGLLEERDMAEYFDKIKVGDRNE